MKGRGDPLFKNNRLLERDLGEEGKGGSDREVTCGGGGQVKKLRKGESLPCTGHLLLINDWTYAKNDWVALAFLNTKQYTLGAQLSLRN